MDQMQSALGNYFTDWNAWRGQAKGYDFGSLKPMHFGWKIPSESELASEFSQLISFSEQGHFFTVNNRKIILLILKQPIENIPVMQLIQRRPGGMEAVGLDHVAFYCNDLEGLMNSLQDSNVEWKRMNGVAHQWVSLRFGAEQREAKVFDRSLLEIAGNELLQASCKLS